jgi:hypothetical protein
LPRSIFSSISAVTSARICETFFANAAEGSIGRAVSALKIMTLGSIERGIENADKNEVLVLAPTQIVLVMLVEYVDVTGFDGKYIALHVFDFAFSGNAITGLKVIAIFQQ